VCGRNGYAMSGFRRRFFRIFANAHAERHERLENLLGSHKCEIVAKEGATV
jgi:hypothetical protein